MAGSGKAHLRPADQDDIVLRVENLVVEFPHSRGKRVHAVSDVSFDVRRGETLGLVGESGCGKSTVARAVVQLVPAVSGKVYVEGQDLSELSGRELRRLRAKLQMIFQDPISSLNPTRRVRKIVSEGLDIFGTLPKRDRAERVYRVLEDVGLDPDHSADRFPAEFSGGQCQRICIARVLALEPQVVICDEPVSALDVSVQAQIINLLEAMKARYGLSLLFIAHDLAVVKSISDRVAVMYLGKMCEVAASDELHERPLHPYTLALLDSVAEPDPAAQPLSAEIQGDIPSPIEPPSGCRFRTRCPRASDRCASEEPTFRELAPDHYVACHHPLTEDSLRSAASGDAEKPRSVPDEVSGGIDVPVR